MRTVTRAPGRDFDREEIRRSGEPAIWAAMKSFQLVSGRNYAGAVILRTALALIGHLAPELAMPTDFSETWRCRVVTHLRERQQKLRPNFHPSCLPQPALPRIDRFRTSPYFLFARKPCRWVSDPGRAGAISQKNVSGQSHPRRTLGDYKLMGILAPTQRACHIPATRPHRWKQPTCTITWVTFSQDPGCCIDMNRFERSRGELSGKTVSVPVTRCAFVRGQRTTGKRCHWDRASGAKRPAQK
jgi:hypothetical protein